LAGEAEPLDEITQLHLAIFHFGLLKNQVDNFAEANKKSASNEADPSHFSFVS
jgi:hypothetical protein